jgi:hypothetical protein
VVLTEAELEAAKARRAAAEEARRKLEQAKKMQVTRQISAAAILMR